MKSYIILTLLTMYDDTTRHRTDCKAERYKQTPTVATHREYGCSDRDSRSRGLFDE